MAGRSALLCWRLVCVLLVGTGATTSALLLVRFFALISDRFLGDGAHVGNAQGVDRYTPIHSPAQVAAARPAIAGQPPSARTSPRQTDARGTAGRAV